MTLNRPISIVVLIILIFSSPEIRCQDTTNYSVVRKKAFSPDNIPKYFMNSDISISEEEFVQLLQKHGRVHLKTKMNKYGEPAAIFVDTTATYASRPNPDLKTKTGSLLPPFVMRDYNNMLIDSEKLKGNKAILLFDLWLSEHTTIEDYREKYSTVADKCPSCTFILLTGSSREEIRKKLGENSIRFHLIPDANGFNRRYHIGTLPQYVILDSDGKVEAYLKSTDFSKLDVYLDR
jgi:hypothetical protein